VIAGRRPSVDTHCGKSTQRPVRDEGACRHRRVTVPARYRLMAIIGAGSRDLCCAADELSQRVTEADACNWGGCDRPQGC